MQLLMNYLQMQLKMAKRNCNCLGHKLEQLVLEIQPLKKIHSRATLRARLVEKTQVLFSIQILGQTLVMVPLGMQHLARALQPDLFPDLGQLLDQVLNLNQDPSQNLARDLLLDPRKSLVRGQAQGQHQSSDRNLVRRLGRRQARMPPRDLARRRKR
jgi:hypothetical protein